MINFLRRQAMVRGILGSSRNWTIVWGVLFGMRVLKRITGDKPEIVYRDRLEPGRTLIIRNGGRPVSVLGAAEVSAES